MYLFKKPFPFFKQLDSQDCSFACLRMVAKYYGVTLSTTNTMFTSANLYKQGITITDLVDTAQKIGFRSYAVKLDFDQMVENVPFPAIFYWNQNHFVIVYKVVRDKVYVADPAFGLTYYKRENFIQCWNGGDPAGIIVLLEPTQELKNHSEAEKNEGKSLTYIFNYLRKHRVQLFLIVATLFLSTCVELIFPFFTQKILDKGVAQRNIPLLYLILAAQIVLFISRIALEFYRSWLFIHISSRVSLSIISDFLIKLMKLPLKFFNSKNIGDLTQRINDHKRIEEFLSKDLVQTVFSIFSIIVYTLLLLYFNVKIFLIVLAAILLELIWIFNFLNKIRILDHRNFSLQSRDQNKIYELINAMQDIKLNNLEDQKRAEWRHIQSKIYLNNIERLKIDQKYQSYRFISFLQSIMVVFVASLAVMDNSLTIGTMLSIMFMLGGINVPIGQLINFVLQYQLVKVSFERLNEVHNNPEEKNPTLRNDLNGLSDIRMDNVNFSYDNKHNVLKDISIHIPKGKTTAIVGVSGSGKTTLIKLLLKFFEPQTGSIRIDTLHLDEIENSFWRNKCGVILQDSHIFSDTLSYNITLEESPNRDRLNIAVELANVSDFIDRLPLKFNTIIGTEGVGLSHGQRQRILIARAIYKNPDYLFFDEATNALDAKNETAIVANINRFFDGKTMIVVAHRLSTVKNADQIIVLDQGRVIECGRHTELVAQKGKYYELIQNQLELGL